MKAKKVLTTLCALLILTAVLSGCGCNKSTAESGRELDAYVDFDNRSFAVNGKIYTLGVNTLQEMIDDGVVFDEDDIANAGNNLNKNYESSGFKIPLGEYYSAQVSVMNCSDDNMRTADCMLSRIYLPVHLDKEQNILAFAFPLDITEEELVAQAGEPTEISEYKSESGDRVYRNLDYKIDAVSYYGSSGYHFEFVNNSLQYITINYLP